MIALTFNKFSAAALEEIQQKFFMQAQWNLFVHSMHEEMKKVQLAEKSWGKGGFEAI